MNRAILIAAFATLCIAGAASAGILHRKLDQDDTSTHAHEEMQRSNAGIEPKHASTHDSAAEADNDLIMETQTVKLATNKRLRRQTNRLARARARVARAAGQEEGEEESSDADTGFNQKKRDLISCASEVANDTIPAAHITGYGHRNFIHSTPQSSLLRKGYQQRWKCCEFSMTAAHNAAAFVDGGMVFNQTDKSLRVPTCGYYHISSQIYYRINTENLDDNTHSVSHFVRFKRNCPSWPDYNPVTIRSMTAVAQDDTTSHTSDVVRLCAGGMIWVEIPDSAQGVPCCPFGDEQATFLAAYLVAETNCHWPPNTMMENMNP